jgi:hypothetical protein
MPAFMAAINYFTEVVTIFHADTNDAEVVQPYFTDLVQILEREHERATAGLVTVPIPSFERLSYIATQCTGRMKKPAQLSQWR